MAAKFGTFSWVNGLVVIAMLFSSVPTPLFAETGPNMDIRVRYLEWPINETLRSDTLYMPKDTSQILRFDRNIVRTAISNPELCDFTPLSTKEILIYAKKPGLANLIVWDEKDKIATYDIYSVLDTGKLSEVLKSVDPGNMLRVLPFNDTVAVYGMTDTAAKLKQINQAVTSYDAKAISFVAIKDPKQILLEVRFAEITRNGAENYGMDLEAFLSTSNHFYNFRSLYGGNAINSASSLVRPSPFAKVPFGSGTVPTFGVPDTTPGSNADIFGSVLGKNFSYTPILEWLQSKNVLKLIARPNLIAKDGEEATFLVGGEFPVPLQTATAIEIDYKEFGTQLKFTPEVLAEGVIRLKLKTEVSELDFSNTVTLGGNTVPSIVKRQHQTVSELKDGETLMVGGMITQRITEVQKKMPFFGDLPGLKYLFQRKEYTRADVELVVIVTPHIVTPFLLKNKKEYFSPEVVQKLEEGSQVYQPGFHDIQADAINKVITQGEERADFALWRKERDKAINDEISAQGRIAIPAVVEISLPAQPEPVQSSTDHEMESALSQVSELPKPAAVSSAEGSETAEEPSDATSL